MHIFITKILLIIFRTDIHLLTAIYYTKNITIIFLFHRIGI